MPKRPIKNSKTIAVPKEREPFLWPLVATLAILAYGLYRAIDLRWICDDAFITMRYVKNFVDGNGLVYNIGERVEGYTHFLWLMMLAAARAIGFDPVDASQWLGIASFAGILILLLTISYKEYKKDKSKVWLPIAAALLVLNYDAEVWASGGLETSFYALLILSAFYLWFYSKLQGMKRLLVTGTVLALIPLTRPDGVLFTAVFAIIAGIEAWQESASTQRITKFVGLLLLPSIVIGVPYLLWKLSYYGDIFPLTYYAKSANENYFDQGFFYIWLYFRVYFISGIALIASAVLILWGRKSTPAIAALALIVVYLILFVARVGGDFMFARFMMAVVPLIYFVIERGIMEIPGPIHKYRIALSVFLVFSSYEAGTLPVDKFFRMTNGKRIEDWHSVIEGSTRYIGDERWYYYDREEFPGVPGGSMQIYTGIGKYIEPFFRNVPVTVAIPGAMNMVAYYANYSTAICEFGLTDRLIAHSNVLRPGHIGHEKKASNAYLRERHVDFELGEFVRKPPDNFHLNEIAFEIPEQGIWQLARLITYNKQSMNLLSDRFAASGNKSVVPLYEKLIAYYLRTLLPIRKLDLLEEDYSSYRQLYFDDFPDTALQRPFEERIAELKRDSAAGIRK